jgi:hypothetical protein
LDRTETEEVGLVQAFVAVVRLAVVDDIVDLDPLF